MENNPKKYWFKNKRYGLGWTPCSWEGWLVIILHISFVIGVAIYAEESGLVYREPIKFFILIGATIALLIAITWKTGEPLKWQWGKNQSKNLHKK